MTKTRYYLYSQIFNAPDCLITDKVAKRVFIEAERCSQADLRAESEAGIKFVPEYAVPAYQIGFPPIENRTRPRWERTQPYLALTIEDMIDYLERNKYDSFLPARIYPLDCAEPIAVETTQQVEGLRLLLDGIIEVALL